MALRLAGERALVIQGADNQGWLREITVQDTLPGLKVNQKGTGRVFDFQDNGVSKMYLPDGGDISLVGSLVFDLTNDVTITPANPAAPRTLTIPDPGANDSFTFLAAAQTLTSKTLTSPTIQGTVSAGTGLTMPAFTLSGDLTRAAEQVIDLTGAATRILDVKNTTASQVADIRVDGRLRFQNNTAFAITIGGTPTADRIFSFPDVADDELILQSATQNIANKTLFSPLLTSPTISSGNLTFTGAQSLITSSGDLTLNPAGHVVAASGKILYFTSVGGTRNARINTTNTQAVSTTAVTILADLANREGNWVFVSGRNQANANIRFADLIVISVTVITVISSTGANGPQARTYTLSGENLQLAMAANTYDVQATVIQHGTPD